MGLKLGLGGERSVDAGSIDLEPLGDLSRTQSLVSKLADLIGLDRRRSAFVETLGLAGFDASALTGFDEVLLDASHHAEDGEQHLAHHVGAIEGYLGIVDPEDGPTLDHAFSDGEEIGGISCQSVGMEDEKFVVTVEQADGSFKLVATMEGRAVADVREDDHRDELLQLILLGGDILPLIGAHASVAKNLPQAVSCLSWV